MDAAEKGAPIVTSFVLKIVAMLSMACDHWANVVDLPTANPLLFVGRLAFPLYAFMVVDSYNHLRDRPERLRRYLLDLGIMAVVAQFPFNYLFHDALFFPAIDNQLVQFFLFAVAAIAADRAPTGIVRVGAWTAFIVTCHVFDIGFAGMGSVLMLAFAWYLARFRDLSLARRFAACSAIMLCFLAVMYVWAFGLLTIEHLAKGPVFLWEAIQTAFKSDPYYCVCQTGCLLDIPFLALYNGEYGNIPRWFRKLYRYFYPGHLIIYAGCKALLAA